MKFDRSTTLMNPATTDYINFFMRDKKGREIGCSAVLALHTVVLEYADEIVSQKDVYHAYLKPTRNKKMFGAKSMSREFEVVDCDYEGAKKQRQAWVEDAAYELREYSKKFADFANKPMV